MAEMTEISVQCEHCGKWFPYKIGMTIKTFNSATLFGNTTNCPHCKKMTGYDKENVKVRSTDAGFVGDKTK